MVMAMAMDMGNMQIENSNDSRFKINPIKAVILLFLNPLSVFANSLTFIPTLALQEIYSDNINLSSEDKQGAFVTSVSPGIFLNAITPKNRLNLNYRMQNVYNAGGNGGLSIFNQLQFNSQSVLVLNKLFLDARSTISQQNIDNTRIVTDNLTGNSNRANVTTFGISPYWRPTFGDFANGLMRVNVDVIKTDNKAFNNQSNSTFTPFSDSINVAEILQLNSGLKFKRVRWSLGFSNNENYRSGGQDVKFQNANALIRTYINRYFNVFASAGYSSNNFTSITNSNNNGIFYTFGAKWMPSQHYSIEAGYGNNAFVTVMISPFQRFNWVTTYRDNSIGLNSGQTWQTSLRYFTRNSSWSITRIVDTVTVQSLLPQLQVFPGQNGFFDNTDGQGTVTDNTDQNTSNENTDINNTNNQNASNANNDNEIQNQNTNFDTFNPLNTNLNNNPQNPLNDITNINDPNQFNITNPTYTNEVIVRTSWNASVVYRMGKSQLGLSVIDQERVYQASGYREKIRSAGGSWNIRLTPRTSAYISPLWQEISRPDLAKDQRYSVAIGVNRQLTAFINSQLEFRHINQTSDIINNDYQENRATASIFMRF